MTSPTEPSNMRAKKAAGVSCSNTQQIERRGRKPESGEDTRLKPLEKDGKQEADLVSDEFAANEVRRTVNNFCITGYVLTGESLRTELK